MFGRVRHTRRARADLLDIWLTIAADSVREADRFFDRVEARVQVLEDFPASGPARPDIADQARMLVDSPYVIIYRLVGKEAEVVRVLHCHRDIDRVLFDGGLDP